ncbi:MAG: OB-fold domain-containing protein [Acidimicrobiia bacterium]
MSTDRPPRLLPAPTGLSAEFYAHAARGELRFQRCDACGGWRHPPRFLCPSCGSDRFTWALSTGRGRIFSWTITHRAVDPAFDVPYAVVIVELEEGVRVVANVHEMPLGDLRLDLPVVARLDRVNEHVALLSFGTA